MQARITKAGSKRVNLPEGTILSFHENNLDKFGVLPKGEAVILSPREVVDKAEWLGKLSIWPYCYKIDNAAEAGAVLLKEEEYV